MALSTKGGGFLSGEPMPGPGETAYPVILLLYFEGDYNEDGITRRQLTELSKWPPGRVNGALERLYKRGFLQPTGKRRRPSVLGKWSRLHGLSPNGSLAARELYDLGYFHRFDADGVLYLGRQGETWESE